MRGRRSVSIRFGQRMAESIHGNSIYTVYFTHFLAQQIVLAENNICELEKYEAQMAGSNPSLSLSGLLL